MYFVYVLLVVCWLDSFSMLVVRPKLVCDQFGLVSSCLN